jgi:hypothetical protein
MKIFFSIMLLLLALVLIITMDDDLDPEAKRLLEITDNADTSNAYIYLLGMGAEHDANPLEVGKKAYAIIRQCEEKYENDTGTEFSCDDYKTTKKLPLPEGKLICHLWDDGCLGALFTDEKERSQLLAKHQILLQRYASFNEFQDFSLLSKPVHNEILPPYIYLSRSNWLVLLTSIQEAKVGKHQQAVDRLTKNIANLRRQLTAVNSLLGEILVLQLISHNLDVLAVLIQEFDIESDNIAIPVLSTAEKDLEIPLARELNVSYQLLKSFDHESFQKTLGTRRFLFKPNVTLNAQMQRYSQAIALSGLPAHEFTQQIINSGNIDNQNGKFSPIGINSIGTILNNIATTDFKEYIARFNDIDAKIKLFNAYIQHKDLNFVTTLQNPYYKSEQFAYVAKDKKSICFDGPIEDTKHYRCLKIAF